MKQVLHRLSWPKYAFIYVTAFYNALFRTFKNWHHEMGMK